MNLSEGQFLCKEGDSKDTLYIVKDGLLKGTSTHTSKVNNYGPGSLIGEFSLIEGTPCDETIQVMEDAAIQEIPHVALKNILDEEPSWLRSILTFLTGRYHIAEEANQKNSRVMALPTLLYLLKSHLENNPNQKISLPEVIKEISILVNLGREDIQELLSALEGLDVLKVHGDEIFVDSPRVIGLLYETIQYRATKKKVSPNILSMTEQMILTAIMKAVQESHEPLNNGVCVVTTDTIKATAKKAMHGMTVTMLTIQPLVQRGLIKPSIPVDFGDPTIPLESIGFFYCDFEKIMDMLELNRIFPQLDKKLV